MAETDVHVKVDALNLEEVKQLAARYEALHAAVREHLRLPMAATVAALKKLTKED